MSLQCDLISYIKCKHFVSKHHIFVTSGISWFFYNLARHPEYQQKCREEINNVLGDQRDVEW